MPDKNNLTNRYLSICVYVNALIVSLLVFYFLFAPFGIIVSNFKQPALYGEGVPAFSYTWHKALTERFEPWARERVVSRKASTLDVNNISGTEWPMYGAVFYLWATEALQQEWEKSPSVSKIAPVDYASTTLDALADLIADPNHAHWVKQHWGDSYLSSENLFYRMLLISGLSSYQSLSGNTKYQALLTQQVKSLATELDTSPHGLLDDYPSECYPVDILPAIAVIQRAAKLLGLDYSAFVKRAVRGFENNKLDSITKLPSYIADSTNGMGYGPARGVGISYMLIWAPEVWPEIAVQWYNKYEQHFWQQGSIITGVREFSINSPYPDWGIDVDAGPIVAGYGTAASAFAIGAARANGRFDHAYPLTAEAMVVSWPLLNGTLLIPRLLSNLSDAPYVGEAALLFTLTRQAVGKKIVKPEKLQTPIFVYLVLAFYFLLGCCCILSIIKKVNNWQQLIKTNKRLHKPTFQFSMWIILISSSLLLLSLNFVFSAILVVMLAYFLPLRIKA